jgi:hypothetical protein
VLQFALKLPLPDVQEIIKDVQKKVDGINTDEDPSSWRPYFTFVDYLQEKCTRNEGAYGEKETAAVKHHIPRPRKGKNIKGKKLFEGHDTTDEEDVHSESDGDELEEEEDDDTPLSHVKQTSNSVRLRQNLPKNQTADILRQNLPKNSGKSVPAMRIVTPESLQPESGSAGIDANVAHDLLASATEEQLPTGLAQQMRSTRSGLRFGRLPSSSAEDPSKATEEYSADQYVGKTILSSGEDMDDEFVGPKRYRL